jgi:hypothetical protein
MFLDIFTRSAGYTFAPLQVLLDVHPFGIIKERLMLLSIQSFPMRSKRKAAVETNFRQISCVSMDILICSNSTIR